jgi:hypothetical protein
MINATFRCPHCEQTVKASLAPTMTSLACPYCLATATIPEDAIHVVEPGPAGSNGLQIHRCLVCPSRDLFIRKDFPQRLGIAIVVLGFAGFLIANYFYLKYLAFGFLFATALIDVFLYFWVGEALVCYRCGAHYRGVQDLGDHTGFQLETHERYRQLAARMAERTGAPPSQSSPGHHGDSPVARGRGGA